MQLDWSWSEILALISICGNAILASDRVLQRMMLGKYARTEDVADIKFENSASLSAIRQELLSQYKEHNTSLMLHASNIKDAHHKIALVEKTLEGFPGYTQFNGLHGQISDMQTKVAVSGERMEALGKDVHEIKDAIEAIRDQLAQINRGTNYGGDR